MEFPKPLDHIQDEWWAASARRKGTLLSRLADEASHANNRGKFLTVIAWAADELLSGRLPPSSARALVVNTRFHPFAPMRFRLWFVRATAKALGLDNEQVEQFCHKHAGGDY